MKLPKDCLLEKICSKDATRTTLAAPYLDIDADRFANVISTNGAAMAKVPVAIDPLDVAGYVPVAALKEARKLAKRDNEATLALNGTAQTSNGATFPRESNATFPNWRQVWPKAEGKTEVAFDARLLYDLAQAMGTEGVILTFDAGAPIAVRPTSTKGCTPASLGARGVIMPVRIS